MEKADTPNTQPPADLKKYEDMQELFKDYEKLANEAATIMICNHSALNMAIEMETKSVNKGKVQESEFEDQEKLQALSDTVGHSLGNDS